MPDKSNQHSCSALRSNYFSFAFFLVGLVLFSIAGVAQITPSFSYTKSEPCLDANTGTIVSFKDESQSTSRIINWIWNFEDGQPYIQGSESPRKIFDRPGVYRVTLTVTNIANETSAISKYLVIYPRPTVTFTVDKTAGCAPLTVQFRDQTNLVKYEFTDPVTNEKQSFQDQITNWEWGFGDGNDKTGNFPAVGHTYVQPGGRKVRLTLTTKEGCRVVGESINDYVNVLENLDAEFYMPPPASCQFPVDVQVNNLTRGNGKYSWTASGPGSVTVSNATATNPVFTFPLAGTYKIKLRATAPNGCFDETETDYAVALNSLTNSFTAPDSACDKATVQFLNQTQPNPSSNLWYVNGEQKAVTKDFSFVFPGPGTYLVRLVSQVGNCNLAAEKSVRIDPVPVIDFLADITSSCDFPQQINFTDKTSGANVVRRTWSFGDGFSRTDVAPLVSTFRYTYNRAGRFSVGISVLTDKGCLASKLLPDYISIQPPVIQKTNLPDSGCAPLTISPSVSFNIDGDITSWAWVAKDKSGNTLFTSNKQFPDPMTFIDSGRYVVSLRIRTSSGCDKNYNWEVKVGSVPDNFDFAVTPADACANTTFQFKYLGPPVTGYKWLFSATDSSFSPEPARRFRNLGKYDVSLTVYNNGCPKVLSKKEVMNVRGVIARIEPFKDCGNPLEKKMVDKSVGNIALWEWKFGDGVTETYTAKGSEVRHTYQQPGEYTVSLKVSGEGCEYYDSLTLIVTNEKNVDFSPSKLPVCMADTFMTLKASVENPKFIKSYEWNYGCGFNTPSNQPDLKVSLNTLCNYPTNARRGSYSMQLRIVDTNNCVYLSPVKEFFIGGPVSTYSALSAITGCSNLPVQFQDKSTGDGTNPVVSRIWDFGDGTAPVNIPSGPVQHIFSKPGIFPVTLTLVDERGCTAASKTTSVRTIEPEIDFISLQSASCLDKNVQFQAVSNSVITSYKWDLGDGKLSSQPSPNISYQTLGKKDIRLTVMDVFGCERSVAKNQFIEIDAPVAKFRALKDEGLCPPFDARFVFEGKFAESMEWDFGDGGKSSFTNPAHLYLNTGVFQVRLKVTSPGGCQSTSDAYTIVVKGPQGSVDLDPFACKPYDVQFSMNSSNTKLVTIDYGDGNVTDYLPYKDKFNYRYADSGLYQPKVFFTSNDGCTINIPVKNAIRTVNTQTVFKPDTTFFCKSGTVLFTDLSLSNDKFSTWTWDFGDGGKGTGASISHAYQSAGIYDVKLVVRTTLGCTDSLIRKALIEIREKPEIDIFSSRSVICEDDIVQFEAMPAAGTNPNITEWFWDFTNGVSSLKPRPDPQQFRKVGLYPMRIYVKDERGCKDTLLYDFEVKPVPVIDAGPDQLMCRGTPVQLNGTGNAVMQWLPNPSLSCLACSNTLANPTGDAVFYLKGTATNGCSAMDSVKINVVQPTKVVASRDTGICLGNSISLFASGTPLFSWSPAQGLNATDVSSPVAKPDQTTRYVVTGRDPYNCFITSDTVVVQVYPNPVIEAGRDTTVMAGYPLQLNASYSADVVRVQWVPALFLNCSSCKTPVSTPSYSAAYTLFAYSDKGCVSKDVVNVLATCTKENMFIPNTFSPNGDGMNEVFYPRGRGIEKIKSFSIFNRWGQLIFRNYNFFANDPGAGWNGTLQQKPVTPDVYVYMIDILCENGNTITLKGDVTLIR